jgi:hypothetical protein
MPTMQEACTMIKTDMAADVAKYDGAELTGRLVAEMHGELAAAISALAGMIAILDQRSEAQADT